MTVAESLLNLCGFFCFFFISLNNLFSCVGEDSYLRGGYITQVYGSLDGGETDAIQLETPSEVRVDGGEEGREAFAVALADALAEYYQTYFKDQ